MLSDNQKEKILDYLAHGWTVRQLIKHGDMSSLRTLNKLRKSDPKFAEDLNEALQLQYFSRLDEIIDIADEEVDPFDKSAVRNKEVRIKARVEVLRFVLPDKRHENRNADDLLITAPMLDAKANDDAIRRIERVVVQARGGAGERWGELPPSNLVYSHPGEKIENSNHHVEQPATQGKSLNRDLEQPATQGKSLNRDLEQPATQGKIPNKHVEQPATQGNSVKTNEFQESVKSKSTNKQGPQKISKVPAQVMDQLPERFSLL